MQRYYHLTNTEIKKWLPAYNSYLRIIILVNYTQSDKWQAFVMQLNLLLPDYQHIKIIVQGQVAILVNKTV